MIETKHISRITVWLSVVALVFCGCFSLPFIGGGGAGRTIEPVKQDFGRENVFVGYDDDKRPIVEMRLLSQEITADGLIIHTRLFPTENFRVRNQFRGLRSINYYPIERRFHRLELRYGRKKVKAKVKINIQVRGQKPFEAAFEHTGIYYLLPDTIDRVKLKFQDVDRWDRLPVDTLEVWYASKQEYLQQVLQQSRRQSLLDTYKRRQKQDRTEQFTQYDSLFITANNAYVYIDKSVDSEILLTMDAGDRIDFGVSDGIWVEFPLTEILAEHLKEFIDTRHQRELKKWQDQRQRSRSRTTARSAQQEAEVDTTRRMTAYVLDVMVAKNYRDAVGWEKASLEQPVDVPLFAQVLRDRAAAEIARQDSIVQARIDSIQAYADSLVQLDSLRADSIARTDSPAAASQARADSLRADSIAQAVSPAAASQASADSLRPDSLTRTDFPATDSQTRADSLRADSLTRTDSPAAALQTRADSLRADSLARADSSTSGVSQPESASLKQNYPDSLRTGTAAADSIGGRDSPRADSLAAADSSAADSSAAKIPLKQN